MEAEEEEEVLLEYARRLRRGPVTHDMEELWVRMRAQRAEAVVKGGAGDGERTISVRVQRGGGKHLLAAALAHYLAEYGAGAQVRVVFSPRRRRARVDEAAQHRRLLALLEARHRRAAPPPHEPTESRDCAEQQ
jgi:hypothetical protein